MEQLNISETVRTLAARLLDLASSEFANHSCNDMDPEAFEGMGEAEIAELLAAFNKWDADTNQDVFTNLSDDPRTVQHIADWEWMSFCAAMVGK